MPSIPSANKDFPRVQGDASSGFQNVYVHGADTRQNYVPLAFQVTNPYDPLQVLLPHSLVSHVNPRSLAESFTKKVERIQTRGGFVEQHWGDELGEISADASTGGFVNINTGLASVIRQRTIAWDRYQDLYDLYRNNGSVYDPYGAIVLQGKIMLMYDRGTYLGFFRSFEVEETEASPFAFNITWTFKVEKTLYQVPQGALFSSVSNQVSTGNAGVNSTSSQGQTQPVTLPTSSTQSPVTGAPLDPSTGEEFGPPIGRRANNFRSPGIA